MEPRSGRSGVKTRTGGLFWRWFRTTDERTDGKWWNVYLTKLPGITRASITQRCRASSISRSRLFPPPVIHLHHPSSVHPVTFAVWKSGGGARKKRNYPPPPPPPVILICGTCELRGRGWVSFFLAPPAFRTANVNRCTLWHPRACLAVRDGGGDGGQIILRKLFLEEGGFGSRCARWDVRVSLSVLIESPVFDGKTFAGFESDFHHPGNQRGTISSPIENSRSRQTLKGGMIERVYFILRELKKTRFLNRNHQENNATADFFG